MCVHLVMEESAVYCAELTLEGTLQTFAVYWWHGGGGGWRVLFVFYFFCNKKCRYVGPLLIPFISLTLIQSFLFFSEFFIIICTFSYYIRGSIGIVLNFGS